MSNDNTKAALADKLVAASNNILTGSASMADSKACADASELLRANAAVVPEGWSFATHQDFIDHREVATISVRTPDGGLCVLNKNGGGAVENLAYRLAAMLAAPSAPVLAESLDDLVFLCGKSAGRQEIKDAQKTSDFDSWVRLAYRDPESTSFTIHNMEVAYQAGRAASHGGRQ